MEKSQFLDLVNAVLAEYLPKTRISERKEVAHAIMDELGYLGWDFEDDINDEETEPIDELDF